MHIEQIRFEEVFDAQPGIGAFSFRSQGRTTYGLKLPGSVIPRAGATFALAFARPDDWSSVLGWRDLQSERVTLSNPSWLVVLDNIYDVWWFGPFLLGLGLLVGGKWGALAGLAISIGAAVAMLFHEIRRNRRIRKALSQVGR